MSDTTLKNFNDLNIEEKLNVLNYVKTACEEIEDKWSNKSLIEIVQSNGITWDSLWTNYKGDSQDDNFHGIEFPLDDYRDSYMRFCTGKIMAAQTFLPYELVEDFDLDHAMELDVLQRF